MVFCSLKVIIISNLRPKCQIFRAGYQRVACYFIATYEILAYISRLMRQLNFTVNKCWAAPGAPSLRLWEKQQKVYNLFEGGGMHAKWNECQIKIRVHRKPTTTIYSTYIIGSFIDFFSGKSEYCNTTKNFVRLAPSTKFTFYLSTFDAKILTIRFVRCNICKWSPWGVVRNFCRRGLQLKKEVMFSNNR